MLGHGIVILTKNSKTKGENKMKDTTICEAFQIVTERWGVEVAAEVLLTNKRAMLFEDFLKHCIACGGNIGGMLLTGVRELYPDVYDLIPEYMGTKAFETIIKLLICLGVEVAED